jgi:hypothetical protein
VDAAKPVSLQTTNVPGDKVLRLVLQQASGKDETNPLTYAIADGIVTISTRKDFNKAAETRVYDAHDLLSGRAGMTRAAALQNLKQLIYSTVGDPAGWADNGGTVSRARASGLWRCSWSNCARPRGRCRGRMRIKGTADRAMGTVTRRGAARGSWGWHGARRCY